MHELTRRYLNEIVKLSPDQMLQLSTKVYSEYNQPFSIISVKGIGKLKTVQIKLRTGIKKSFTVGG